MVGFTTCQTFVAGQLQGTRSAEEERKTAGKAIREEKGVSVRGELTKLWKQQPWSNKVNAAEFLVEYFRIQDGRVKRITIQRMRAFLEQVKVVWQSSSDPGQIRELSASLPIPRDSYPSSVVLRNDTYGSYCEDCWSESQGPGSHKEPGILIVDSGRRRGISGYSQMMTKANRIPYRQSKGGRTK